MLGMEWDDPTMAGLPVDTEDIRGFTWNNKDRTCHPFAKAMASELFVNYTDDMMGTAVTRMPNKPVEIKGHMTGSTIQISGAPSASVHVSHEFPGKSPPLSRMALLPPEARALVLGIVSLRGES